VSGELAGILRSDGGLLAGAVASDLPEAEFGRLAVEAVREGYRLHYGQPRVVRTDDEDLALLAGDRLYALGLDRLAQEGDLETILALADVISACAAAHAEGRPEVAHAAWQRLAR
jgi:hypothetical protein